MRPPLRPIVGALILLGSLVGLAACGRFGPRTVLILRVDTGDRGAATDGRDRAMTETVGVLKRRLHELSPWGDEGALVSGYEGVPEQLEVTLPRTMDVAVAKRLLLQPGRLELRLVEDLAPDRASLLIRHEGTVPPARKVIDGFESMSSVSYLLGPEAVITSADLRRAWVAKDENGAPAIHFHLTDAGGEKLARTTSANIGRQLAIVFDDRVQSAPTISGTIRTDGMINGRFTKAEADVLAAVLRAGTLPRPVTCVRVIDPAKR